MLSVLAHAPDIVTLCDKVQGPKREYPAIAAPGIFTPMANARANSEIKRLVGARLALFRDVVLGKSQSDMARHYEFAANRWNQYENGERLADIYTMIRFCDDFGATLDWLYRGDLASLPARHADAIREHLPAQALQRVVA
mgnify:CR=1 FL=1